MIRKKRKTETPSREEVREAALNYLSSRYYTLWPSGGWDITQPDRREKAADWATDFFLAIHEELVQDKEN